MCMDNIMICWEFLSMVVFLLKQTIYSSGTTLTEESNQSKQCAFSCATRLSTQRISSCLEAIMNVPKSIVFMASTMNVNEGTALDSGKSSVMYLIAYLLLPSLMRKYSACMEVWVQNWRSFNKSKTSWGLQMYLTPDYYVTCYGQIQKGVLKSMETMTEELALHLARASLGSSTASTIST